jgi:hypothetical protein
MVAEASRERSRLMASAGDDLFCARGGPLRRFAAVTVTANSTGSVTESDAGHDTNNTLSRNF